MTNPAVDPVKARAERKAKRTVEQMLNSIERPIIQAAKREIKLRKRATQERIRATTPEIATLDLIRERTLALRSIESVTNDELLLLRRRLVTAERLVETRTRERDSANQAHKTRLRVHEEQLSVRDKKIEELRKVNSLLHNKVAELEGELARKNHKKVPVASANGTQPETN